MPDLVRNVIKEDINIIEATLDKSEKNRGLYSFLKEAVAPFGITDEKIIKNASKEGWRTARSVSLSWGAREVGSPFEWRAGARHCSRVMGGESGLETC